MSSTFPVGRSGLPASPVDGAQAALSAVVSSVQFVGFWTAVAAPFALIAMLAAGIAQEYLLVFGGLLLTNLVSLRLGAGYKRED